MTVAWPVGAGWCRVEYRRFEFEGTRRATLSSSLEDAGHRILAAAVAAAVAAVAAAVAAVAAAVAAAHRPCGAFD